MKLWYLEREVNDLDEVYGLVIRADSVRTARLVAAKECMDEGPQVWLDSDLSTCEELLVEGETSVIVKAYVGQD